MIEELSNLYKGFYVDLPLGNNAISYSNRTNRTIFVPPIIMGNPDLLEVGIETVFGDFSDGQEIVERGLKNLIFWQHGEKNIFIFDNHNHAFFFWIYGISKKLFPPGKILVHIDRHADMWAPINYLILEQNKEVNLVEVFNYTIKELNIYNFIRPALALNIFSEVEIIDCYFAFNTINLSNFILDIDIDVFSKEVKNEFKIINFNHKLDIVKGLIARTNFITIATSPHYIDQKLAIRIIKQLFE